MATEVSVRATGPMLTPRTLDEAMKFSELLAKSDLVPKEYKGKPGNVLVAIQWGFEIGLQPLQALQNLAVINGRPSIWGDAALALVRGSGLCESLSERIDGEGERMVAICTAKRRGQEDPIVARFSVADARQAALWGRAGPWSQYSARMLTMRARGFCLRDGFADVLRGVITVEEAQDYPTAIRDVTPTATADLDAFAGQGSSDIDAESVASTADATLIDRAHMAADSGSVGFREFYFGLDDDQRLELRPDISSLKQRAVEADQVPAAPESIDDLDAFGLKPIAEAASPAVEPDRDQPAIDPAPTDPSSPRERSEAFWSQDELHVSNSGSPRVIEFEIKRFLAECRDHLDVNGIEQANGPLIAKLPRATREDVEAAIAARRAELPTVAK